MALHAEFRFGVRLFREPDAGNPPVRFDEREEETEPSQTGMRRRGKSPANRHREATVTAPLLDSTQIPLNERLSAFRKSSNTKVTLIRPSLWPTRIVDADDECSGRGDRAHRTSGTRIRFLGEL